MKKFEEIEDNNRIQVTEKGIDGGMGYIYMPGWKGSVIWSNGMGWEHVSVSPLKKRITPSWDDMCMIKEIFFNEDEYAVQFHPAKSEYVNNKSNCLHIWRPLNEKLPTPPTILIGLKEVGQLD